MSWTEIPEKRSKQVAAIARDAATKTTSVRFRSGPAFDYHYHNVSEEQHNRFIAAESLGSHLAAHFKNKFQFTKTERLSKEESDRRFDQPHHGHDYREET